MKKNFLFFGLLSLFAGCADDDLPKYTLLEDQRILAMIVDTPEVSAGSTVDLSVLTSDVKGRARTYSLEGCLDPGVGLGAEPTCSGNPTRTVISTGNISNGNAGNDYTAVENAITVTIPSAGVMFTNPLTGSPRSSADQYNGVAYLLIYEMTASDGAKERSFKRVIVSTKGTKNTNPSATQMNYNGVNVTTPPTLVASAVPLRMVVATNQAESYSVQSANGSLSTQTEELLVTWYVTSGEPKRSRTNINTDNTYTPSDTLPANLTIVGVLRDDRGGVDVRIGRL